MADLHKLPSGLHGMFQYVMDKMRRDVHPTLWSTVEVLLPVLLAAKEKKGELSVEQLAKIMGRKVSVCIPTVCS